MIHIGDTDIYIIFETFALQVVLNSYCLVRFMRVDLDYYEEVQQLVKNLNPRQGYLRQMVGIADKMEK